MRKYVGFAKEVGQISNTARSNLIKYSLRKKVFTAELDSSPEQILYDHRGSIAAFLLWLVWLNSGRLHNIKSSYALHFSCTPTGGHSGESGKIETKQETAYTHKGSTTLWVISALTYCFLF